MAVCVVDMHYQVLGCRIFKVCVERVLPSTNRLNVEGCVQQTGVLNAQIERSKLLFLFRVDFCLKKKVS